MFKKIMVGVDGSEHATKALDVAVSLASAFDAELHVFHAVRHHFQLPLFPYFPFLPDPRIPFVAGSQAREYDQHAPAEDVYSLEQRGFDFFEDKIQKAYEEAGEQIIKEAKEHVARMEIQLEGDVTYFLETVLPPEEYAASFARENDIDLIVLGCVGHHSGAKASLLGTVATKLLNDAPCNVLIVR